MEFAKGNKPSWKDTLDSQKDHWGHIDEFEKIARLLNYTCFEWNGRIYEISGDGYVDTGWLASELDNEGKEK